MQLFTLAVSASVWYILGNDIIFLWFECSCSQVICTPFLTSSYVTLIPLRVPSVDLYTVVQYFLINVINMPSCSSLDLKYSNVEGEGKQSVQETSFERFTRAEVYTLLHFETLPCTCIMIARKSHILPHIPL